MKSFVQPGTTITLIAPYAVASGDGLLVGSIFGVAAGTAALGEPVETALVGVYELKKLGFPFAGSGMLLLRVKRAKGEAHHGQLGSFTQGLRARTRLRLRCPPRQDIGQSALLIARQPGPEDVPDMFVAHLLGRPPDKPGKECLCDDGIYCCRVAGCDNAASLDYIKAEKRREGFARACPDFVIVDEAHASVGTHKGKQQRFELLAGLARDPERRMSACAPAAPTPSTRWTRTISRRSEGSGRSGSCLRKCAFANTSAVSC